MKSNSVTRYLKFLPLLGLFAFGVVLISLPRESEASPVQPPTVTTTFVPINGTTTVTAQYNDDSPVGSGNAVLAASGALGTFLAGATVAPSEGETVTVSGTTVTVAEDADTIPEGKTITATFQCLVPGAVTFTLSHGGTTSGVSVVLICGQDFSFQQPFFPFTGFPFQQFPFQQFPTTQFPTVQFPNVATAAAVTVTASPTTLSCAGNSSISVAVRDTFGAPAANGTSVTISASTGAVAPNVVSTSGGVATTTYTAPSNSNGTATITATSGTGTGFATVTFSCAQEAVVSQPSQQVIVPPPSVVPSLPVVSVISPPRTGDAGLLGQEQSASTLGAGLVVLSVIGLTAGALTLRRQRTSR